MGNRREKTNESYKVSAGFSRWYTVAGYEHGLFFSADGIVVIYSQGDDKARPHTQFECVHKGRKHSQRIGERFSRRGLSILAGKFLRSVVTA